MRNCVYFMEKNVHGAWVVYGELGVRQYYYYTKKEARRRYIEDAFCQSGSLRGQTKMTELMKRLVDAGYPKEEFFHHYSDLYIFATPLTQRVVNQWCKDNGYHRHLFVSTFRDQITGRPMYDCAFQYAEGD